MPHKAPFRHAPSSKLSPPPRAERGRAIRAPRMLVTVSLLTLVLAGCQVSELAYEGAHLAPVPASLERKIDRMGMEERAPILLRIYKQENTLEVWKQANNGRYKKLQSYEICAWSGELGPKIKEGDRQAPEGFYTVTPAHMNPNSSYHLSFNLGFPNAFDRAHGRTGSHLMVHGDCSSRGCYAMEDEPVQEIYALAREAFRGGQQGFQVQAFPFRMTPENMAKHADSEHFAFWEMLKKGSDHFEVTGQPPKISVCDGRYVFNAEADSPFSPRGECPAYDVRDNVEQLVAAKWQSDLEKRQSLIARAVTKEQREDRWEERERAIATFFDRSRNGEAETAGAVPAVAAADEPTTVVPSATAVAAAAYAASVPIPRRSPRAGATKVAAAPAARGGIRLPNPFARRNQAVASTSGVTQPAPAPAPAAQPAQPARVAVATPPNRATETPVEPLGYAPAEKKDGFFGGVARGSVGLFKRAGSIFN